MNKAEKVFTKYAAKPHDQKTYPISRGLATMGNISTLGISRFVSVRSIQGRRNMGLQNTLSPTETQVLRKIKAIDYKKDAGKSYPISRFSNTYYSLIPAAIGGLFKGKTVGGAVLQSSKAVVATSLQTGVTREIGSRAILGRSRKGKHSYIAVERGMQRDIAKK